MSEDRMALARGFNRIRTGLSRTASGMVRAVRTVVRRLEDFWLEVELTARDIWFRLSLLGADLAKILGYLSPGLGALLIGALGGGPLFLLVGGVYCVGLLFFAIKLGSDEGPLTDDDLALEWTMHFRPSWHEDEGLVAVLRPVLNAYLVSDAALQSALADAAGTGGFVVVLHRVKRSMRVRMQAIRSAVEERKRLEGREVPWSEESTKELGILTGTPGLFSDIQETLAAFNSAANVTAADSAASLRARSDLDESLRALRTLLAAYRELDEGEPHDV